MRGCHEEPVGGAAATGPVPGSWTRPTGPDVLLARRTGARVAAVTAPAGGQAGVQGSI